jgi:signal transduction histidine kinase
MTFLLVLLLLIAAGGCVWLWFELRRARLAADAAQTEMKRLQETQSQVIHTTKLASLGQMVAGVAHEINTPLGFVKSNAEVVTELLDEHLTRLGKCVKALDAILAADLGKPELLAPLRQALARPRSCSAMPATDSIKSPIWCAISRASAGSTATEWI